jgi:peptidyl-tRNA hydrolase
MSDNFNLKKYLVENKATTNSQMISEIDQNTMMELAKAVAKYYNAIEIGIHNTSPEDLEDDLQYVINDVDNRGNQALKTAYEQIMDQPFRKAKQDIHKIWDLAEDIASSED